MKQMPSGKEPRNSSADIFQLLTQAARDEKRKRRRELLGPLDITEYFTEGKIEIDKRTCRGVECKLCVKACPTNALYWKQGQVGIIPELCVYCGACVLFCVVDDCIRIERKRSDGVVEKFSKSRDALALQNKINTRKRFERVEEVREIISKPARTRGGDPGRKGKSKG